MTNKTLDYVIVTHDRATFFAERGEESDVTDGYYNVYELDPEQSEERNHYCISEEFIHDIEWK
jgi:hypothetical protein|tara:strand:- start:3268 stop:3456 length:189 start_codon:yes stop_codon:yes gene_type:complete